MIPAIVHTFSMGPAELQSVWAGGMKANATWNLAGNGEVLSAKKSRLASVSKNMLTPGLAPLAGGDLQCLKEACVCVCDKGGWRGGEGQICM